MAAQLGLSASPFTSFDPIPLTVNVPKKGEVVFSIQRPLQEVVYDTAAATKMIFVDAFEKSYTRYYEENKPGVSIEAWLRINKKLREWLSETFDEEFQEYQAGKKGFLYLYDDQNQLVGWLSHSLVDNKGDLYLSQCSLDAGLWNQKISTAAFTEIFANDHLSDLFPGIKEIKLIVRKINKVAQQLYTKAGFACDETISPEDYGASYDDRYVGYRRRVKVSEARVNSATS